MSDFPGKDKKIGLIGIPLGYAAGQVGSELGVTAMRLANVRGQRLVEHLLELGFDVKDHGDVAVMQPAAVAASEDKPKYLPEMIASCEKMVDGIGNILAEDAIPVILGGDHSIAMGTFSGMAKHHHDRGEELGLVWFDAHADMNTPETSPSGNLHGMPLATLLGTGQSELVNLGGFAPKLNPKYCAHIGARDLDLGEKKWIRDLGLSDHFFTMRDIDEMGMKECVSRAIAIASQASGGYAVTFDVDVIDPRFAPGSGTLVRGGITYREAHLGLEMIAEDGGMRSFEIVEVNPMLDQSNLTAELAVELILSALGKTIL
jgi:arginase